MTIVQGRGPAVFLVHGFPLSAEIWRAQAEALSSRYQVIAPDLPGFGGAAPLPGDEPATMERLAGAVLEVADQMGIETFAVAGHSMGGYLALALQKLAPHRVAGLALVASQSRADTPDGAEGRRALAAKAGAEGHDPVVGAFLPKLFGPQVAADAPVMAETEALIRKASIKGIQAALLGMAVREEMRPHLPKIKVPVLALPGVDDKLFPPDRAEEVVAAVPDGLLIKVEGAGHMPMLEQPEATSRGLATWLERVYPPK